MGVGDRHGTGSPLQALVLSPRCRQEYQEMRTGEGLWLQLSEGQNEVGDKGRRGWGLRLLTRQTTCGSRGVIARKATEGPGSRTLTWRVIGS